ncbi:MAG: 3-deoxy-8-phosphooctulonate synthase [Proteobacteria bacterium]|nr:3-deoxy-8-phosphooctulonate synthase [Pseudomonadota bacterium]NBX85720.1 3-deoxy-8-phosphooctulonate synthase [Pseudomonadota bacterium]
MGNRVVNVGDKAVQQVAFGQGLPMALIAGTCAIEGREITLRTAETVQKIGKKLGIGVVYKGSFDKANRTSAHGERGVGLEAGLAILAEVRKNLGIPVLTDVHECVQVTAVCAVVDVVQIPAFLARQTDLLLACGQAMAKREGGVVNIKKGQFMAPADMGPAAGKVLAGGCENVLLTERGTTFGYGDLVVDMRGLPVMAAVGHPVIFDVTHSIMQPSGKGDRSGGKREFAAPLARAAVAVGVAGLFVETHPEPAKAFSDRETQIPLDELEDFLRPLVALDKLVKAERG